MVYAFKHEGKVFVPGGAVEMHCPLGCKSDECLQPQPCALSADIDQRNAALEARELDAWAARPSEWSVYVTNKGTVTTWTGVVLGTIFKRTKFRTNVSRNMVSIRFRGTNGATYYGRYGADWSQLCRVRKSAA